MTPSYWLDLFTVETWKEFVQHGSDIAGFSEGRWICVRQMKPGDVLLCYLTKASKWIGALEIVDEPFLDDQPIWSAHVYPSRVHVHVLIALSPERGIPVLSMRDQLTLFEGLNRPEHWSGAFRKSARKLSSSDGEVVVRALKDAHARANQPG